MTNQAKHRGWISGMASAALAFVLVLLLVTASAATYRVVHTFEGSADGDNPRGLLIFDAAGNLYGVTSYGGPYGLGTVFELTRGKDGGWTENVIHDFTGGWDGGLPVAGLVFDVAGNLYGTTFEGGGGGCFLGCGVVFELTPESGGRWKESVLHVFHKNGRDGLLSNATLVFDGAGNLYGTSEQGGAYDAGTVFKLSASKTRGWKEAILHNFTGGRDGIGPYGGVIFGRGGNLYGCTLEGGASGGYGYGTVFELIPSQGKKWKEKVLHSFQNDGFDGQGPLGPLVSDTAGNLYGPAAGGGTNSDGIVFELTPKQNGEWNESVLYAFTGGSDGRSPVSGLVFDAAGRLFGTTGSGYGTVFELKRVSGTVWKETTLYTFTEGLDGFDPISGLASDGKDNFYGTTYLGGAGPCNGVEGVGCGVVFEVTP